MKSFIKTEKQIAGIRESAHRLAEVMRTLITHVKPGIDVTELDKLAHDLIVAKGDVPSFFNYTPEGASHPYPASLCVSVNSEVVHGIPTKGRVLHEGDIVTLDCGINHRGFFSDHAVTVPVGTIPVVDQSLLNATREALMVGIEAARAGNFTGDIGNAIESFVDGRYGIVRVLSGHGVGLAVHEDPFVPNFGKAHTGTKLVPGMVIAIEPMLTLGTHVVKLQKDGYTYVTNDGKRAAHFEHTVLITDGDPEILTT